MSIVFWVIAFWVAVVLVGTGLYLLLAHHSYARGVEDGRNLAVGDDYERGVAAGQRMAENAHGWGPVINAPDVPAERVERSPDFNLVTRVPEPERMPRAVFDY